MGIRRQRAGYRAGVAVALSGNKWVSDRTWAKLSGRLLIGSTGLGITSVLFYRMRFISTEHLFFLYGLCGLFVGVIGVIPALCVLGVAIAVHLIQSGQPGS